MIVKRIWTKNTEAFGELWPIRYTGWFLFGFIPLYIVREG